MSSRPGARIATTPPSRTGAPILLSRATQPLLVASVSRRTPDLEGADWLRIDGACGAIEASYLRERFAPRPLLLDIPGPNTRRNSLMTATEYLVFAASQEFEWVNLREVSSPKEIERARLFLPPSTKLTASVHSAKNLRRNLAAINDLCDAVLIHAGDLEQELGFEATDHAMHVAVRDANTQQTPALVISDFVPGQLKSGRPAAAPARLDRFFRDGYRGLVLTRETTATVDPQSSVDHARAILDAATLQPRGQTLGTEKAAKLSGSMTVSMENRPPVRRR